MKKWTKNSKYPKSQICHFQGISLLTRDPSHSMPPKLPMIEKTSNQVPSNGIPFQQNISLHNKLPSSPNLCVRVSFPPTMALRFPHGVSPDCLVGFRPLTRQTTSMWCNREVFPCPNPMKPKRGKVAWTSRSCCWNCQTLEQLGSLGKKYVVFFLRGGGVPRLQGF